MAGADWRSMIRDQSAVNAARSREKNRAGSQYAHISRVGLAVAAHNLLVRAAKRRGISISGYIRRATLAVVAMDLGMNAVDLFEMDNGIAPPSRRGSPSKDLDGAIYGRWEVQPHDSRTDT